MCIRDRILIWAIAAGAAGLAAAINYIQSIGFDYMQKRAYELTKRALDGLNACLLYTSRCV